jgi:hypothetical protein
VTEWEEGSSSVPPRGAVRHPRRGRWIGPSVAALVSALVVVVGLVAESRDTDVTEPSAEPSTTTSISTATDTTAPPTTRCGE